MNVGVAKSLAHADTQWFALRGYLVFNYLDNKTLIKSLRKLISKTYYNEAYL